MLVGYAVIRGRGKLSDVGAPCHATEGHAVVPGPHFQSQGDAKSLQSLGFALVAAHFGTGKRDPSTKYRDPPVKYRDPPSEYLDPSWAYPIR